MSSMSPQADLDDEADYDPMFPNDYIKVIS